MEHQSMLEQLRVIDPVCDALARDLFMIEQAYQQHQLTESERQALLLEIRDIRAAQECAGNEVAFRLVVQACNIMMRLM